MQWAKKLFLGTGLIGAASLSSGLFVACAAHDEAVFAQQSEDDANKQPSGEVQEGTFTYIVEINGDRSEVSFPLTSNPDGTPANGAIGNYTYSFDINGDGIDEQIPITTNPDGSMRDIRELPMFWSTQASPKGVILVGILQPGGKLTHQFDINGDGVNESIPFSLNPDGTSAAGKSTYLFDINGDGVEESIPFSLNPDGTPRDVAVANGPTMSAVILHDPNPDSGRYQLSVSETSICVLDTATGVLNVRHPSGMLLKVSQFDTGE